MKMTGESGFSGGDKIFITGVTGFIGSSVARDLSERGYTVAGLVRETPNTSETLENLKSHISIYKGDLRDPATLSTILRNFSPDGIIHLGAVTPVSYSFSHPHEVMEVNHNGTINLAEAAKNKVPHLKKFVFSSSVEVYGTQDQQIPFTEDITPKPDCPYAVAKLASEKYLAYLYKAFDFPSIRLRQTNTYGRKHNAYFVVEAIITRMLKHSEVNLGNPEPYRSFLHIDDLTELYAQLMKENTEHMHGEVYNTGPDNPIQIRELADKIRDITGFEGEINWGTREQRPLDTPYLNTSNEKLRSALDWQTDISLEEGLERAVEYWSDEINQTNQQNPSKR